MPHEITGSISGELNDATPLETASLAGLAATLPAMLFSVGLKFALQPNNEHYQGVTEIVGLKAEKANLEESVRIIAKNGGDPYVLGALEDDIDAVTEQITTATIALPPKSELLETGFIVGPLAIGAVAAFITYRRKQRKILQGNR